MTTGKVIPSKHVLPIVSCYRFAVSDARLTITATDTENVLTASTDVVSDSNAMFCVEAKRLVDLLKAMGDCLLQLTLTDKGTLLIQHDKSKYSLPVQSADYFPTPVTETQAIDMILQMPSSSAVAAMNSVAFAMGSDTLRPMMIGVLWDVKPNSVTFVATDTKVLAAYTDRNIACSMEGKFILPAKSVELFRNMFAKEAEMRVMVTPSHIIFSDEKLSLCSVRVKGNYPDYTRVIPQSNTTEVLVTRQTLRSAIGRVAVCANQDTPLIKVAIAPDYMRIEARDMNFNVAGSEVIDCTTSGNSLTVGLSSAIMKDILTAIEAREVKMLLSDPSRPVLLRPTTSEENIDLQALIMPMNISE